MTPFRLLLRNLLYHWRGNLAVFLGVVVGAAVLTGALLVGDSLRGSLRDLTLERLGWVDDALVGGRFFREKAAEGLAGEGRERRHPGARHGLRGRRTARRCGRSTWSACTEAFWWPDGWQLLERQIAILPSGIQTRTRSL